MNPVQSGWAGQPMPPHQSGWAGQPPYPGQQGWTGPQQYPAGQHGWHGQQPQQWRPPVVKPGVIPLRPLGLGEILDGAISTMRAHPKLMLGVAAVVVTITQLIILAATYPLLDDLNRLSVPVETTTLPTTDELLELAGLSLAVSGIALVVTVVSRVFLVGFVTFVVGIAVLGHDATFSAVWARVRPRLLPLLGLTLVYPAVVFVTVFVVVLLTLAVPALGILAVLGVVVVGIWLWIMFSLATPVLVLESTGVGKAFGRSRHLVRGAWWRIFGITLLSSVIAFFLMLIVSLPFEYLGDGFATLTGDVTPLTTKYLLLTTIGAIIASTLTEPFVAAVTALLYTDQRMRREGLDIELARAAGDTPT